jgi:putative transposase
MSNAYTNCVYHVVFSTKDRFPFLSSEIRPRLFNFVGGIVRGIRGRSFIANGVDDHLHLLAMLPSHRSVSDSVRDIKANSSRWLRKTFPDMKSFAWQRGYGAFSVSESQIERVHAYIANQEAHHRRSSFQQEFLTLLRQNRVAFDPERVWR